MHETIFRNIGMLQQAKFATTDWLFTLFIVFWIFRWNMTSWENKTKKLKVILRPKQCAIPHAAAEVQHFLSVMQSFTYRTCAATISRSALKNLKANIEFSTDKLLFCVYFIFFFFFPYRYCVPLHLSDSQRTLKCLLHKISRRKEIFKKQARNRIKSEWKTQLFSFAISKSQNHTSGERATW